MNILQKLKFTERKEVAQGNSCSKARIKTDKILPPNTLKKHIIHPCPNLGQELLYVKILYRSSWRQDQQHEGKVRKDEIINDSEVLTFSLSLLSDILYLHSGHFCPIWQTQKQEEQNNLKQYVYCLPISHLHFRVYGTIPIHLYIILPPFLGSHSQLYNFYSHFIFIIDFRYAHYLAQREEDSKDPTLGGRTGEVSWYITLCLQGKFQVQKYALQDVKRMVLK